MSTFEAQIQPSQLSITPNAHAKFLELLSDTDDDVEGVRIYVAGGGCNGMSYGMTFTDVAHEHDMVLEQDGVKVYVDAVAAGFMSATEIDYVEQGMGASFVFNNAFAVTTAGGACGGCGSAGGGGGGCA